MLLFRAGNQEDINLRKGSWWSNSLKQIKPYFNGRIVVIEIPLMEKDKKRYMVTKEVKKFGHHNGYGVWTRVISNISEELDENYYYISPEYLETYGRVVDEFEGRNSLDTAKEMYS